MKTIRLLPFLGLFLAACATTAGNASQTPAPAAAPEHKDSAADDAQKKEREVTYARASLEIAQADAENEERSSKDAVAAGERDLDAARKELEAFTLRLRDLEVAERKLALDRAKQNVIESQQELDELEGMYKEEQFAGKTKELVLTRGRARLEMSQRDLELAQRRMQNLVEVEHKKRERDLNEAVAKSERALVDARAKLARSGMAQRLAVLKAENAVEDAQRALEKSKAAAAPA